jgi:hypothetical protein
LVAQGDVLDDHGVGFHDRLVSTNFPVVKTTKRDDGRPGALGPETRERLCVTPLVKGRDREDFGRCDDPLTTPAMNTDLKHDLVAFRIRKICLDVNVQR